MKNGICVVGDNSVDIYSSPRQARFLGGNGLNTALAVSLSGVKSAYAGMIGNDADGDSMMKALSRLGISVERVRKLDGPTGWTRIALVDGDRKFIEEDIGVQRSFDLGPDDYSYLGGFSWVHHTAFSNWPTAVEGDIPSYQKVMSAQLAAITALPCGLSVDFSGRQDESLLESAGRSGCLAFFSRDPMDDHDLLYTIQRLSTYGFPVVVVTMGEGGSAAWDGQRLFRQEALPTRVVDTLGAGDAFIGSFLARWAVASDRGSADLREALLAGASLAARVCAKDEGYRPVQIDTEAP